MKPVALITGANKGIGLEIAHQLGKRGYRVILGARSTERGGAAAKVLQAEGIEAESIELDVTKAESIAKLPDFIRSKFGQLDVLINNAAILLDNDGPPPSATDPQVLRDTFETNFFGVFTVTQTVLPFLCQSPAGRIVNLSSSVASSTSILDPVSPLSEVISPAYQASKTAVNALTVLLAKEPAHTTIKVNSACPGPVKTDQNPKRGLLSLEEGADTPVWLATLPADGPNGGFFNSRKPVPW
ncbi:SDR family oxidoreductase [Leptolyngbya sp. FACHB-671]|uniref:SDR family oxidoreductase n=1 Tax=Leptolyngbya sp. FACHB-671 TaxID=2692812 RepID=UPI001689DD67|nr:SDR family oxidoreductase [Leptolyngbya sp. FACHB-671]MBD2068232.1 SDR family oxidoreductase [Leptolyngbya sp. FACHB-671]